MRSLLVLLATVLTMASPALLYASETSDEKPAPTDAVQKSNSECGCMCCCQPVCQSNYAYVDAIFLDLDQRDRTVTINQNTLAPELSLDNADYGFEAGERVTIGHMSCDVGFEASYFGIKRFNGSGAVTGNNDLQLPGDIAFASDDFFGADRMQVTTDSQIQNVEFNMLKAVPCSDWTVLAGFRYIYFDEHVDIRSTDSDSSVSDYLATARNNLFGAQLGARYRRQFQAFNLEFVSKAGIFGDAAQEHNHIGDFGNTVVLRDVGSNRDSVAFVGELGLNSSLRLTQSLYWRAGYNLLFLQGIARGADQLDFSDTPTSGADTHLGGAFLHGPNTGLECRW